MCTIARAKVQLNYNCYNVYFNGCLLIKHHRLKSSSAVQAAAKKLLEYDLLTRSEGFYFIADPLMALWLKSGRF